MSKRVFVSYSHNLGEWVWQRLVPILRAAGCTDVLIDKERFRAGHGVIGQMDATQDQADVSLLVLTPDYLASDYCRHEMERAVARDAGTHNGSLLPVKLADCDLSALRSPSDSPVHVDLTRETDPAQWALLLKSLNAENLGTSAPHWLDVRDEIVRKVRDQQQSVNLVVRGAPNWKALRDHLQQEWLPDLAILDLDTPGTATLDGLVRSILRTCGCPVEVPNGRRSVPALDTLAKAERPHRLALTHFDNVQDRRETYGQDLFKALRYLVSEAKSLILLAESRIPAKKLLPGQDEASGLAALLHTLELREDSA